MDAMTTNGSTGRARGDSVLKQREDRGVRGFAFGPNEGSLDYAQLFTQPDGGSDLRERLSAFKVYDGNIWDPPSNRVGPNTETNS
jgi:hypothetical protein